MKEADPSRYSYFSILYAEILSGLGNYDESDKWLDASEKGLSAMLFPDWKSRIVRLRAQNASGRGDMQAAFTYQKRYEAMRDTADMLNMRDLSKRYNVEYEVNLKDRQIADQKQHLQKIKIRFSWAIALFVLISAAYMIYNWRRRRFYRDIVRQNLDFMKRQKVYEQTLAEYEANTAEKCEKEVTPPEDGNSAKLHEMKLAEIFAKIRELAEEKQLWRDVNISRDSFADMVGCNRTYFSEAIKAGAGMSYTQYMNSLRIREAMKVLSDPANNTPLKDLSRQLGFLTLANFYASFKKEIGMSPAAFRKTARSIKGQNDSAESEN